MHIRMRTIIFLSLLTAFGTPSVTTLAADEVTFTWLKGKGTPVCEEYKTYVDSFVDPLDLHSALPWPQKPMCARTIPARFSAFAQPRWRELDPADYVPMMVSISDNLAYDLENYPGFEKIAKSPRRIEATIGSLKLNHKNGHYQWFLAYADIDNDGKPETVVKWRKGRCNGFLPDSRRYSIPILIIDPEGTVDRLLSRQVLNQGAYPGLIVGNASFDVFQYARKKVRKK